ncbi:UDP-N-acetylmuramoyl-L-alanyl-D-glutamate--2,6-diaminopimelate ligase [Rubrobacter indicoceani]|uniref:UDP-N-acetylmuramoyl-L-alanyl-D-glutamate--2, 6-diaminopimelate ligase n=1 Tax=Rubrobacter indicoceani TaxID=2051957 RepID=UPI000E5A2085|nr:UDP-N-acetylmuramoyl-L-alanyl-D-glutamate--2,6-diaminopimelate ligase [Rubrobacter indicoceani]
MTKPERRFNLAELGSILGLGPLPKENGGSPEAGVRMDVHGVTHDSREAGPGMVFVAVQGFKRDGMDFAREAVRRGSPVVVAERSPRGSDVPVVVVPDAREALARLACEFSGRPSEGLAVYGVTGTNGKTTTSYVLHGILSGVFGEGSCGLMTTVETIIGDRRLPSVRTTPEATEVQRSLAGMRESGVGRVVMEVSSHGVSLKRVYGTRFSGAIFTNLTRDHLDLHGSMEEYYLAKRGLFLMTNGPKLVNVDDEWGVRLAREVGGALTFGTNPDADYRIKDVAPGETGTAFSLRHPAGEMRLHTPLLGSYNVLNVAGAASLALAVGADEEAVCRAARRMEQVPGRFERVPEARTGFGFEVIVDYAHTDVGLHAVLEVARDVLETAKRKTKTPGRIICVFGAAGERDGAKRPLMGRVAAELADACIVTTDDAYGEDPKEIATEVFAGIPTRSREAARVILDREEAIRTALNLARAGDVVVVAGKGHEQVQHLPAGDVPFHDPTVVREILREMGR